MRNDFELLADALRAQMHLKDRLDMSVGARELQAEGAALRLVIVPIGGVLGPPSQGPYTLPRQPDVRVRPLYTNALNLVAYLYAPSLQDLLALWVDFLTASSKLFGKAAVPGAWVLDTENDRAAFVHGDAVSLRQEFTWNLFVSEYAPKREAGAVYGRRTVRLTTMDLTFDLDDGGT